MSDVVWLSRACELVGRFLYHFSRVEMQLNEAIIKLFKLDPEAGAIITANIEFFKKLYIVQCAVSYQESKSTSPIANVEKIFNRIASENQARQIVAHSAFEDLENYL